MKIDMHVHVTPEEIIRDYKKIGENEPYFNLLSNTPHNKFATAEQILEEMKLTGIDKSVVFGFSFNDMGLCQYVNDYVIEKTKAYPEELIGFISVVPNHKDTPYEIERCFKAGLRGIGELFPAGQSFEIDNYEHTKDFGECCRHFKLPVIIHTNEPVGHYYAGKTETPLKKIEAFIEHHQELQIILAHFGGGIFMYELMKEVRAKFANVYYDNAAGIFLYEPKIYHVMKEMGLMDKLLFGSDFPLLSPQRYEQSLKESQLSAEDMEKLYSQNAVRLFEKCGFSVR